MKSINDDEIDDIEYDKAMEREKKRKNRSKILQRMVKLLNRSIKIKGIKIYYIFWLIFGISLLIIIGIFIIFYMICKKKNQSNLIKKNINQVRYFGEIGNHNVINPYPESNDDIHIIIHQERLNDTDTYCEPSSPSRDVIV